MFVRSSSIFSKSAPTSADVLAALVGQVVQVDNVQFRDDTVVSFAQGYGGQLYLTPALLSSPPDVGQPAGFWIENAGIPHFFDGVADHVLAFVP